MEAPTAARMEGDRRRRLLAIEAEREEGEERREEMASLVLWLVYITWLGRDVHFHKQGNKGGGEALLFVSPPLLMADVSIDYCPAYAPFFGFAGIGASVCCCLPSRPRVPRPRVTFLAFEMKSSNALSLPPFSSLGPDDI